MALRIITLLFFFFTSLELLYGQTELEVMQQQLIEIKKKETEIANQIEDCLTVPAYNEIVRSEAR